MTSPRENAVARGGGRGGAGATTVDSRDQAGAESDSPRPGPPGGFPGGGWGTGANADSRALPPTGRIPGHACMLANCPARRCCMATHHRWPENASRGHHWTHLGLTLLCRPLTGGTAARAWSVPVRCPRVGRVTLPITLSLSLNQQQRPEPRLASGRQAGAARVQPAAAPSLRP